MKLVIETRNVIETIEEMKLVIETRNQTRSVAALKAAADLLFVAGLLVVMDNNPPDSFHTSCLAESQSSNKVKISIADLACWMYGFSCQGIDTETYLLSCLLAHHSYLHLRRGGIQTRH
jgi:hypothetical protein